MGVPMVGRALAVSFAAGFNACATIATLRLFPDLKLTDAASRAAAPFLTNAFTG